MISILSPEVRIDEMAAIAGRPNETIEVSRSGKTENGEAKDPGGPVHALTTNQSERRLT